MTLHSLIAGIAGINPYTGTLGSVCLARYAIQVALANEIDAREIPANWTTGYFLLGSEEPGQPAVNVYGTEVYEVGFGIVSSFLEYATRCMVHGVWLTGWQLNTNLRDKVKGYLDGVSLNDTADAAAYRFVTGRVK